ncbi:DUF4265 domain-containing protein [Caballeronia sp. dw_19]|uniref:DUF4265 domain-containing protein n=1 Tax=Caballeronia sp. dw_19 TaxID=2719791 RepID=UPI001BD463EF|nr:DUF4265 domain-containing protein [Caballeronia sp. dw_19]
MKYETGEYEAVHQTPVWRDRADFVFAAHLGIKDGKNEWEQLWGQKTGTYKFILCCIPFFVHDVALGDEVETDSDFVLQRVVHCSGQTTYRVWFGAKDKAAQEALVREIEAMKPLMEWSSENLLALSISGDAEAQSIANYLQAGEEKGLLQYETGRTAHP